ncbi:MAG: cation:proton antiporter [Candidatus Helarchaeota archaeon]
MSSLQEVLLLIFIINSEIKNLEHYSVESLLLIIICAFIVPIITYRFKKTVQIPVVLGEIIVGLIIGKSGLNIIKVSAWQDFLAFFGFAFSMFLCGLEINFEHLIHPDIKTEVQKHKERHSDDLDHHWWHIKRMKFDNLDIDQKPILYGIILFCVVTLLSFVSVFLLWLYTQHLNNIFNMRIVFAPPDIFGVVFYQQFDLIYLALVLTTTSVSVVFPTLSTLGITETDYGLRILNSAIIADFVSMMCITSYIIFSSKGIVFELLLFPLIFIIAIISFQLIKILKKYPKWFSHLSVKDFAPPEIKITASIFLLLFVVFLSDIYGIEMILGAFFAGLLISFFIPYEKSVDLRTKLHALGYAFTIPIFFIVVGINFKIDELFSSSEAIFLLVTIVITAFLVKIIPNIIYHSRFQTLKEGLASGVLQSSRLSLLIAAAYIGLKYFLISPSIYEILILTAVLTSTISPIIFTKLQREKT